MNQAAAIAINPLTDAPFQRGEGEWKGVVMIERPRNATKETPCRVMSARDLNLGGRRAIGERMPYGMFSHYFTAEDGDSVCVYAEFKGGHIEFYERATRRDFFHTVAPPALH